MTKTIQIAFSYEALDQIRKLRKENTDEARKRIGEIEAEFIRPMTAEEEVEAIAFEEAEQKRILETGYIEKRKAEYPPISDQLDVLMKWLATENEFGVPDELKSLAMKCMSVKAKYPKPSIPNKPE